MQLSDNGLNLIKAFEGLRLDAYYDPGGTLTIGYGHTAGVQPGQHITPQDAADLLRQDLAWAEQCVDRYVTAPITQEQYDALVSLVFNIGCGAFMQSTLLRKLNAGDYESAAEQFGVWIKAGGKVLPGLVRRREDEEQLFRAGLPTREPIEPDDTPAEPEVTMDKLSKLSSRKLWATAVSGLLIAFNDKWALGLDDSTIWAIALLVGAYVVAQGWVDTKGGSK